MNACQTEVELWTAFLGSDSIPKPGGALNPILQGTTILITGAGGFIGAALTRQLAMFGVAKLLLLDISELGLYRLELELRSTGTAIPLEFIVGSIIDRHLMEEIFAHHAPTIVFHAAACKHVPLMESNPFTAASTNALGTRSLVKMASRGKVAHFILLSTDKVIAPTSMMGATKRLAELALLDGTGTMRTRALRLGNVLGSSGSVAPRFLQQILAGNPVTVAHPEAMRYFVSIGRAVHALLSTLLVEASSAILVPEMGEPYRIQDLADFLIERTCSHRGDAKVIYTGLRPGDKLEEQLVSARESFLPAGVKGLRQVNAPMTTRTLLSQSFKEIASSVKRRNLRDLVGGVRRVVPDYHVSDLLALRMERDTQVRSS